MKLSIPIIEDELQEMFRLLQPVAGDRELRLLPPFLYDGGPMEKDRIYIMPPDKMPPSRGSDGAVAICAAQTACSPEETYGCTMIYTDAASESILLNRVQKVFEKYQSWEKGMNDILTEDKDALQKLFDLAAKTHNNMFFLQDAGFVAIAIAYGGIPKADNAMDVEALLANMGQPMDSVDMDRIKSYFPTRRQSRTVMHHMLTEYETLDIPLYEGSVYIGMLSMLPYNRAFQKKDYSILEFFSAYVAHAMSRSAGEPNGGITTLTSIFADLLESKHISKKEIQKVCSTVGYGENDRYIIGAILFPTAEQAEYANYLHQVVTSGEIGAIAYQKGSILTTVVNTTLNSDKVNVWLYNICKFAQEFKLQIGISDSFTNFQYCELYFKEASATLSLLPQNSPPGVYFFKDFGIPYILEHCPGQLMPEMLYTDGFKRLLEYEDSAAVSYIDTLRAYLEENLSPSRTARRLFISRNTFLARYERLCDVLQEDLADPDVRFRLEVSLRLYGRNHKR